MPVPGRRFGSCAAGGSYDLRHDPNNCQAPGDVCPPGSTCGFRFCIADGGALCSETDPCPAGKVCNGIGCAVTSCAGVANGDVCSASSGAFCCNGACTDGTWDSNNCGGCGNLCPSRSTCANGSCTGLANPADCAPNGFANGSCVSTTCAGGNRNGTLCGIPVPEGLDANGTCCGTVCANLQEDNKNCGGCNLACPGTSVCVGGSCQPPPACPALPEHARCLRADGQLGACCGGKASASAPSAASTPAAIAPRRTASWGCAAATAPVPTSSTIP